LKNKNVIEEKRLRGQKKIKGSGLEISLFFFSLKFFKSSCSLHYIHANIFCYLFCHIARPDPICPLKEKVSPVTFIQVMILNFIYYIYYTYSKSPSF